MRVSFLIFGLVAAALIIGALQWWPQDAAPPAAEPPQTELRPAEPEVLPQPITPVEPVPDAAGVSDVADPPSVVLPALADSDDFVLAQLAPWSLPQIWLEQGDLLARLAVTIQNAADGQVPRRQLGFLAPSERFEVRKMGERLFIDQASYRRFDGLLTTLERIPPAQASSFVKQVMPLLDAALQQLGEQREIEVLLLAATRRIETAPQLPAEVELLQPNVVYTYADERLEALPEFEKQLLRLGPQNLDRLRRYAASFREAYLQP